VQFKLVWKLRRVAQFVSLCRVRTILKFITTTQLSMILRIQTKSYDTNCNNPAFQAQNNDNIYIYAYSGIRAYWDLGRNSNIKVSILRKNKRPLVYRYATEWCKYRLSFRAINPYNLQPVS
jgi:hypothetical protein